MEGSSSERKPNRLAKETSPYLQQHQNNPVDWYAWGPEAFEAAKRENKPIFLSVGYSTCYWCHVMERQSFENEQLAAEMNKRFINIKVDREERPDVDQLYMTAVQVLTRHGGWPMSVFLTPDLKPFYGGTYFPPTDQHGRPGFLTVLTAIDEAYRTRPEDISKSTGQLVDILQQLAVPAPPDGELTIDAEWIDKMIDRSTADYDPRYGGFGGAPKFPRQTLLELLLVYVSTLAGNRRGDLEPAIAGRKQKILGMVTHTLDALAQGGIRDQLGGGFHRYSTDAKWLVPHFEIMLYDNAMLAWIYTEAYRQTEYLRYAKVARGILDFILREMTSPEGAFYTAFDAEVDAQEGLSYLWTKEEIESILGPEDAKVFNEVYGVDKGPNFADPHHGSGTPDKSILHLPDPKNQPDTDNANEVSALGVPEEIEPRLAEMRQKLYGARRQRKQPLLDTKIITSWNALTIRAFAYAGEHLQEQRYIDAAARAADFLLRQHRMLDGGLYRTSRDGVTKYEGFLDDYAFLCEALLALRRAGGSEKWREHAAAIALSMLEKFGDRDAGGFFFTSADAKDLIVRQKVATDSPLPSGNAVAAGAMMELGRVEIARDTLAIFAGAMDHHGESMSSMIEATLHFIRRHGPFKVRAVQGAESADRPLSPEQLASRVVTLRAAWASPTQLNVHVSILNGFHINAHEASQGLLATQLSVTGNDTAEVASIDYPPGEEQRFAFSEDPLRVYTGEVLIAVRFKTSMTGEDRLTLSLYYQACDDDACLPPVSQQLQVATP